jgi:hypothetical protein
LPLDRLGDNLYYLGFIYTLASLSAALLQLDVNSDLKAILGNFGIALITTIIGISGRVAFVQMRREIDHAEARAQRDILEAATKLKGQLQASVSEFEVFLTSVRQALREQFEIESQKSLKSATVELERISEVAKLTADRIAKAFDTHEQQAKRLGELVGQVATNTEQALKQLSETGQSLSNLGCTAEGVQSKLSNWIKDLETFATRMGDVAVMARNLALGKGKKRRWRFWRSRTET